MRLPRRAIAAALVEKEQRWMPDIAKRVTVAIPTPVRLGLPSADFPWRWTITRWLDGDLARPDLSGQLVADLAQFVRELHVPAPAHAPRNPVRGGLLTDRNATILARLADEPVPRRAEVVALWSTLVT